MDNLFSQATPLLLFLLPGFLSAWVFYGLTSHLKPSQFERIVQALVFTLLVSGGTQLGETLLTAVGKVVVIAPWTAKSELLCSIGVAVALGVCLAQAANKDVFHSWLRRWGLTSRTSYPSEWFTVLDSHRAHVVLNLKDGRRLVGWPREWPVNPERGHFYLEEPGWIREDDSLLVLTALEGILVNAIDVHTIELYASEETEDDVSTQRLESACTQACSDRQLGEAQVGQHPASTDAKSTSAA